MLPKTARPAAFVWPGNVAPHGKNVLAYRRLRLVPVVVGRLSVPFPIAALRM